MFTAATLKKLRDLGLPAETEMRVLEIFEEAREAKKKAKGGAADRVQRGTRIDAEIPDLKLPREWGEFGLTLGLARSVIESQWSRFGDYWKARPGAGGIKLDWFATWRNWLRRVADDMGAKPNPFVYQKAAQTGTAGLTAEQWAPIVRVYRLAGQWHPDFGPEPGKPGCLVPFEVLEQHPALH